MFTVRCVLTEGASGNTRALSLRKKKRERQTEVVREEALDIPMALKYSFIFLKLHTPSALSTSPLLSVHCLFFAFDL